MREKTAAAAEGARARWSRVAALGLLLAGAAPLLILLAILIWGLEVEGGLAFLLPATIVPWIAAFLVWRYDGTWPRVVGIVVGVLMMGLLFWTAFGLQLPASFFDFMPGVLALPGALIAIIFSIAAIVAGRRGDIVPKAEGGERRAIVVVAISALILALLSGVLTIVARSTVEQTDAAEIGFRSNEFDRDTYEVGGGSQVVVRNLDPFAHTFTIDDLDIDVVIGPRGSTLVDIPAQPGEYVAYCVYHVRDIQNPGPDDMVAGWTIR